MGGWVGGARPARQQSPPKQQTLPDLSFGLLVILVFEYRGVLGSSAGRILPAFFVGEGKWELSACVQKSRKRSAPGNFKFL